MAVALAIQYPSLVKRLGVSEYVLPGFGYEAASAPGPYWDLYGKWQLAFFSVPDAADSSSFEVVKERCFPGISITAAIRVDRPFRRRR